MKFTLKTSAVTPEGKGFPLPEELPAGKYRVTIERMRVSLPVFARWDGDTIVHQRACYSIRIDENDLPRIVRNHPDNDIGIPAWVFAAFRAEGLL
jgi:hypothetical protein